MIVNKAFSYQPTEGECEKASNAYVMSLVALIVGLPLPIVNLIATAIFFFGNRNSSSFVRWHCIQALLSQLVIFILNTSLVTWTIINISNHSFNYSYWLFFAFVLFFDLMEFVATIYSAIQVRKGKHVAWWGFESITDEIIAR